MTSHKDVCLHCRVAAAVEEYFQEHGDRHGDLVVVNVHELFEALGQIMAEHLAATDPKTRRRYLKMLVAGVNEAVPIIRAEGSHMPQLRPV